MACFELAVERRRASLAMVEVAYREKAISFAAMSARGATIGLKLLEDGG